MIYYTIPFDSTKNIGKYYNEFAKIVPNPDDYICVVDGDTIFTTPDYGIIIENTIKAHPEYDCLTCYTNRIGCPWQIAPDVDPDNNDHIYHRTVGKRLKEQFGTTVEDKTNAQLFSGMFFIIKKSAWDKIGGVKGNGMLGVDNEIHRRIRQAKLKLGLMKGLYIYHFYRWPNPNSTYHLK